MPKIIGTYEARTHWSEILQAVQQGERFTVTHRGVPIAEITPPQAETRQGRSQTAAKQLLDFMNRREGPAMDIKAAIEEGRD